MASLSGCFGISVSWISALSVSAIAADHLGGVRVVVFVAEELHFDLGRVLDHVVVGQDEAVLRADDEAGAGGRRLLLALGPAAACRGALSC